MAWFRVTQIVKSHVRSGGKAKMADLPPKATFDLELLYRLQVECCRLRTESFPSTFNIQNVFYT